MEDETVEAVQKVAIGSAVLAGTVAVARATTRGFKQFDKKMRSKKPKRKARKKRPLKDNEYGVVMSKENKRKLGMRPTW